MVTTQQSVFIGTHGCPHGDASLRASETPNLVKDNTGAALSDVSVGVVQIETNFHFEAASLTFSNRGLTLGSPSVSPTLCHQSSRVSPLLTLTAFRRWKQQPVWLVFRNWQGDGTPSSRVSGSPPALATDADEIPNPVSRHSCVLRMQYVYENALGTDVGD